MNTKKTVVLELKLPVPVSTLAAIIESLEKLHGKDSTFMRQVGPNLQFYKPTKTAVPSSIKSDL